MKKYVRNNKGITLIALIVTIIVLIILAGVSISLVLGENGILTKAKQSKIQTEVEKEKEQLEMVVVGELDETLSLNLEKLKTNIKKELPYANIVGNAFPIKVTLKYGAYSVNENGKIEKTTGISLDATEVRLGVGDIKQLNAILTDIEGTITWSSNNEEIATIDASGKVTALTNGTAKITVKVTSVAGEEYLAECIVKVLMPITSITIKSGTTEVKTEVEIAKDGTLVLTAETLPNTDETEDVKWTSSNENIAIVTGSGTRNLTGIVKGIAGGEVTITASGMDGVKKEITVNVVVPEVLSASNITAAHLSDSVEVNYNGKVWNILYADADNEKIYLILKNIVNNPAGSKTLEAGVNSTYSTGSAMLSDIGTNKSTQARFPAVVEGWFSKWMSSGYSSTNTNMKATLYMLDSNVWNGTYRGDKADWAIGGPTMELFAKSYDKIKGYTNETDKTINKISVASATGYKYDDILFDNGNIVGSISTSTILNNGQHYWVAAPSSYSPMAVRYVNCDTSNVNNGGYSGSNRLPMRSFSKV